MSHPKKTGTVCIAIHGLSHAGAERVAVSWANYLAQREHPVMVLVYAPCQNTYALDERVRIIPLAETHEAYYRLSKTAQLLQIRSILRREHPELIISFLPKMQISVFLASLGLGIKRMETIRNNPWVDRDVAGKRFIWNLCFATCRRILLQTPEQALYFPKILRRKCVQIPNPISADFLLSQKHYADAPIRRFLAVASLRPQKNYPMMIRAFAQTAGQDPQSILDIYGAGSEEEFAQLQTLISDAGMAGRIRLQGWRKDIASLLGSYDAFLMSSDYEGMPNALAEAMAAGLICLSTDCRTGPKDMIQPGKTGFLAATGQETAFAEGIRAIQNLTLSQRRAMSTAARTTILELCREENTLARMCRLVESEL